MGGKGCVREGSHPHPNHQLLSTYDDQQLSCIAKGCNVCLHVHRHSGACGILLQGAPELTAISSLDSKHIQGELKGESSNLSGVNWGSPST